MSLSSPLADPGFFGKDDFVPFIAQVEDVNDPKQSGRVKVRCVGWHPKDKADLATEDLPWARVGMPTTHAQIGRVGGKHGLLPGSMVMGFFMDGHDAQKPFILTSFNATSNATEKSNTRVPTGVKGKLDDTDRSFGKTTGPQGITNLTQSIVGEQGKTPNAEVDRSGDNTTSNALPVTGGNDKARQSQADFKNRDTENAPGTETSMNWKQALADPKCGASSHAGERIQIILQELFPNDQTRFAFNDAVYNSVTGGRIELNSVLNLIAFLICDVLKDSIEVQRGLVNDLTQRPIKSAAILSTTTREYATVKAGDQASKATIDIFNKSLTLIIDGLCMLIKDLLQALNNQTDPGQGDNAGGNIGASALTPIGNIGALCVTELIIQNVLTLITAAIADALGLTISDLLTIADNLEGLQRAFSDGDLGGILDGVQGVLSGLGIGGEFVEGADTILGFITDFKFTLYPLLFNTTGLLALDIFNLDKCNEDGSFATSLGALKSIVGGGGVGSSVEDFLPGAGFGGLPPGSNTGTFSTTVCDDALGVKIPGVDFTSTSCRVDAVAVSVPSSEENAAQNFINGIANAIVIKDPGCELFFDRGDRLLFDISNLFPPDDVL